MMARLLFLLVLVWGCGKPDTLPTTTSGVFDPLAFGPREAPASGPQAPAALVDYGPQGTDIGIRDVGQVFVRFTQPMVAFGSAADQASDALTVRSGGAAVAGHAYWQTPERLVFDSVDALPPAQEFDVEWTGTEEVPGVKWSFETSRPTVALIEPVDRGTLVGTSDPIYLRTTLRTSVEDLAPHVSARMNGRGIVVRPRPPTETEEDQFAYGDAGTLVVLEHDVFDVAATVNVTVRAGWRSAAGPLPAVEPLTATFRVHPRLAITHSTCPSEQPCGIRPIELQLSTPVARDQLRHIHVTPKPPLMEIMEQWDDPTMGVRIDGRFLPGQVYTITIDPSLTDVFAQRLAKETTFEVEFRMPPEELFLIGRGNVLADGVAHVGVSSRHIKQIAVRAAKVSLEQYRQLYFSDRWTPERAPPLEQLGEIVERTLTIPTIGPTDWGSTPLDIAALMGSYKGPVVVEVTAIAGSPGYESRVQGLSDRGVMVIGSLAPLAFTSTTKSVLRVENLTTERVARGVDATIYSASGERKLGTTDTDGIIEFDGRPAMATDEFVVVHDRASGEMGIAPLSQPASERSAAWLERGERLTGELVAERGVYRPGDDLFVAGWSVVETPHNPWGQRRVPDGVKATLELVDQDGVVLASTVVDAPRGRFWSKLEIPTSAHLGTVLVRASYAMNGVAAEDTSATSVRVEEFRTPTFEVLGSASSTEVIGDEAVVVDIESRYLSGPLAPIRTARARRTCWDGQRPDVAGWLVGVNGDYYAGVIGQVPTVEATGQGRARIAMSGLAAADGRTLRCSLSATVQNKSFQEEGVVVNFTVHPSDAYIGLPDLSENVIAGTSVSIQPRLFDVGGKEVGSAGEVADFTLTQHTSEPVYASRGRNSWVSHWEERETVVKRCRVQFSKSRCRSPRLKPGEYVLEGQSRSDSRRRFRASFTVQKIELTVPIVAIDAPTDELKPGAPVELKVTTAAPHGTLVVERHGMLQVIPFETKRGVATVSLATTSAWAPEMRVSAWVVHRGDPVPRMEVADATLRFDASERALDVRVTAPATASVREEVRVDVVAADANGPVAGRAVVWAVDDALLAMTDYEVPDLSRAFYPAFVWDVIEVDSLAATLPRFVPERYDPYSSVGFGMGGGSGFGSGGGGLGRGGGAEPRADFRATPLYLGDVDVVDGKASLTFRLPDSMTRFRVIAIVSADLVGHDAPVRFGSSEATISVGAPLVLRPALPRFVRPGDTPELAVIVQNASDKTGSLHVEFELEGEAIDWVTGVTPQQTLAIGANSEVRVGFAARVLTPGKSTVTMRSRLAPADGSPSYEDSVQLTLVSASEPTITETVATYGTIDDEAAALALKPPAAVQPDVGGVSLTLTSTILGGLRDATRQLVTYPYGCAEQTASRMLPLVALAGLAEFVEASEIPNGKTAGEFVDAGIQRLLTMQRSDGGFGYWPTSGESHAYVSAYVTWVLHLASKAGHDVPAPAFGRALDYLEVVTAAPDEDLPDVMIYFDDVRRAIAVHVLAETGRKPTAAIERLLEQKRLPVFARAFVVAALAAMSPSDERLADLTKRLVNSVRETPGSAHVVETPVFDLGPVFHSDLRSSAIVMIALIRTAPKHPVISKLARGLMEKRYRGAWRNTQENAYALVALGEYARVFEATEPNFAIEASIDNAILVSDRWKGRSSKAREARVPMNELLTISSRAATKTLPLRIRKSGEGRAYYRLAMTYAPSSMELPAIGRGIDVRRVFRRDGAASSKSPPNHIAAGEILAIDIELQTRAPLRYVAVNVPVPAGFEPIDLTLGSAKTLPMHGVWGWWVSYSENHDDRIVLFADTLQPGPHRHTVYVRASSPGTYSFPPSRAEAMYTPEVFGRTVGTEITVD